MSDEVSTRTSSFCALPENCISNIISLTSAKDACRVAAVSHAFKSAADSDTTWQRFLPPNHTDVAARASPPLRFSSKKHLYFLLRNSTQLLDDGSIEKAGALERRETFEFNAKTGKALYTLGARKLQIGSIDDPKHWEWTSLPELRFAEVAKLRSIKKLEIRGIISSQMLSPNTTYVAWLVYRFTAAEDGLDVPSKASIKFVKEDGTETAGETSTIYLSVPVNHHKVGWTYGRLSWAVKDDLYEIELGEFSVGDEGFDVHIEVSETECLNLKKGLVVVGIALRPKYRSEFPDLNSFAEFCLKRAFGNTDDLMC